MKDSHLPSFWRRIGLVLLSCGVVGLLTFVCFQLHISADITGLLYLVVIALISLQGRFIPALISSIVALFCLHYFFTPPLFELLP
ncbi:MAG TPA: DUF4118 domain-containing protein, partial [Chthoniobacterales bacterium]|nr:DUF4118 domain-containing protein [Chthoniobacterales bacterium]